MGVRSITVVAIGLMIALTCQAAISADLPKKTNPANDSVTGPGPGMTYGPSKPTARQQNATRKARLLLRVGLSIFDVANNPSFRGRILFAKERY